MKVFNKYMIILGVTGLVISCNPRKKMGSSPENGKDSVHLTNPPPSDRKGTSFTYELSLDCHHQIADNTWSKDGIAITYYDLYHQTITSSRHSFPEKEDCENGLFQTFFNDWKKLDFFPATTALSYLTIEALGPDALIIDQLNLRQLSHQKSQETTTTYEQSEYGHWGRNDLEVFCLSTEVADGSRDGVSYFQDDCFRTLKFNIKDRLVEVVN